MEKVYLVSNWDGNISGIFKEERLAKMYKESLEISDLYIEEHQVLGKEDLEPIYYAELKYFTDSIEHRFDIFEFNPMEDDYLKIPHTRYNIGDNEALFLRRAINELDSHFPIEVAEELAEEARIIQKRVLELKSNGMGVDDINIILKSIK